MHLSEVHCEALFGTLNVPKMCQPFAMLSVVWLRAVQLNCARGIRAFELKTWSLGAYSGAVDQASLNSLTTKCTFSGDDQYRT